MGVRDNFGRYRRPPIDVEARPSRRDAVTIDFQYDPVPCPGCGRPHPVRPVYCGGACRVRAYKARRAGEGTMPADAPRPAVARFQQAKTHCPRGHPYDAANTYWAPRGDRRCRTCRDAADKMPGRRLTA